MTAVNQMSGNFKKNKQEFKLVSNWLPAGDQPKAISELVDGIKKGLDKQTLLGVTGSGKTFTIANVIEKIQKPTLVIAHNKTLAAQLANEFKEFFPNNKVHYFVSYYDYYQPEAYVSATDTYIEKDASINEEIDRLRHASTQSLLTRNDVIIVASVSCIYGLGSPEEYFKENLFLEVGQKEDKLSLMEKLVNLHFTRTNADLKNGTFRAVGNRVDINPMSENWIVSIFFSAGEISLIQILDPISMRLLEEVNEVMLFPAKHFVTSEDTMKKALINIEKELEYQIKKFEKEGKLLEADRIKRRTREDIAMMREVGYCSGIENYSRHLSGKKEGEAPETLMDYFLKNEKGERDFLTIIDESHVTLPQLQAMYAGDRARKINLVNHGFRLPSALDNRPLKYEEFTQKVGQIIYVSATPSEKEITESKKVVEQIIRPTGLIDPILEVKPVLPIKNNKKGELSFNEVIIFIPGMSGIDNDFKKLLEQKAKTNNQDLYFFENWENNTDLQEKSLIEIKNNFDEFYKNVKQDQLKKGNKNTKYYLIAKSFGGCFSLFYDLFDFEKVVLWAPAGGIDKKSNLKKIQKSELKNISNIEDLKIGIENLQKIKSKCLLVFGKEDKVVKKENQILIAESLKKCEFIEIDNLAHSPKNKKEAENLLYATFNFLSEENIKASLKNQNLGEAVIDYPGQIEDFIKQTEIEVKNGGRVLCTTLTKKMAEDLSNFLKDRKIKAEYIHSDVLTLDRIKILTRFRKGEFDVLVGVNLLREGLDLPEVSLIGILDADKEGFLRSETSLIQTIGRAARNVNGRVILYADVITGSLENAIKETERRRKIQEKYNKENNITPQTVYKNIKDITEDIESIYKKTANLELEQELRLNGKKISALLNKKEKEMKIAAKDLDFETAAILRDEIKTLNKMLEDRKNKSDKNKKQK